MACREERDRGSQRRFPGACRDIRLERLATRDDLEKRRADGQVDERDRGDRAEVGEQFDLPRVAADSEERVAAGERGQCDRRRLEGNCPERAIAQPPHAECRRAGEQRRRPGAEHDRSGDVQC